jgi:hypothetical protein
VEIITIIIYGVIFYRYYSKRQLRKSMDVRDKARSDLYLAQLRSQSAPNTPGFGPKSPGYSLYGAKSPRFPPAAYSSNPLSDAEEGMGTRFVDAPKPGATPAVKPFTLQPPPIKIHGATPKVSQSATFAENDNGHVPAAPGEQQYASVPIPGAYQPASPGPTQTSFGMAPMGVPGMALSSDHRIESPPSSPRMARYA